MVYYIVFVYLAFLAVVINNLRKPIKWKNKYYFALSFVVLVLLSSCRFEQDVHSDFYRNYMHAYNTNSVTWKSLLLFDEELLHPLLRKTVITLFHDPQAYFFVTSVFIISTFFVINKKYSPDFIFSVLLFYCMGTYFSAHNITRQYIAIAITMFAWKYAIDRKIWNYLFVMVIAIGFHSSAIVTVPLYFLAGKKFNKNVLWAYLVLTVFIVAFNRQIVSILQMFLYRDYGRGYGRESSNPLRLVWTVVSIGCVWLINHNGVHYLPDFKGANDVNRIRFRNLICHGAILNSIFLFLSAVNMLMFSRVASYFSVCSTLVMLHGISSEPNQTNKKILKAGLLALAIAWFIVMNYSGKLIPTPYTPFWEFPWRVR